MGKRLVPLLGLWAALSMAAPAFADVPNEPPKTAAKPDHADKRRPFLTRPAVVGVLAALLLVVMGGAAGANDKRNGQAKNQ
ncbi:MAG: hypothetical protein U0263_20990 [Polyangiaceae bacterium]